MSEEVGYNREMRYDRVKHNRNEREHYEIHIYSCIILFLPLTPGVKDVIGVNTMGVEL